MTQQNKVFSIFLIALVLILVLVAVWAVFAFKQDFSELGIFKQ